MSIHIKLFCLDKNGDLVKTETADSFVVSAAFLHHYLTANKNHVVYEVSFTSTFSETWFKNWHVKDAVNHTRVYELEELPAAVRMAYLLGTA